MKPTRSAIFDAWRVQRLPVLQKTAFAAPALKNVTVVIYHFWDASVSDQRFWETEFAILQTWSWCGKLPVKIITNAIDPAMQAFAEHWGDVTPVVSPRLIPGRIPSMSLDLVGHLSEYFDTEYVLIIQNDGFPLRAGLDQFVGAYGYCGAPFTKEEGFQPFLDRFFPCSVGNGGFCLRSRAVCQEANRLWKRWRWLLRESRWMTDDTCYCVTFRLLSWRYRRLIRFPSRAKAFEFSYDHLTGVPAPDRFPFGVHGLDSFEALMQKFPNEIV